MTDPRLAAVRSALAAQGIRTDAGQWHLVAQCDHATLATAMRAAGVVADALATDCPYSAKTHDGHDDGTVQANRAMDYARRGTGSAKDVAYASRLLARGEAHRREIDYPAWATDDVDAFVGSWHPLVRGWIGSLTDDVLAPDWRAAMEAGYRYAFSPLACVETGSRFRATGDGPPQWSTWLCLSRPRSREWVKWATIEARATRGARPLPGAYIGPSERKDVTGGKPLWLMRAIVGDYSAPGDLVCDPCMGAGTTLVAAVELGRRAIGCEPDNVTVNEKGERVESRFQIACRRLAKARPQLRMHLDVEAVKGEQSALALGAEEE